MRVFCRTTRTAAAVLVLVVSASMLFVAGHAESPVTVTQSTGEGSNSLKVTQSTEDGLKVECEGNLKCKITRDDIVVANSEDNGASHITSTNILTIQTLFSMKKSLIQ